MCPRNRKRPGRTPFDVDTYTLSPILSGPKSYGASYVVVVVTVVLEGYSRKLSVQETLPKRGESTRDEAEEYERVGDPSREKVVVTTLRVGETDRDRNIPELYFEIGEAERDNEEDGRYS